MKPFEYDLKIITTIKAFREARGVKQHEVAEYLGMSESYYCKYEHGQKSFSSAQVKLIGKLLRISHIQILAVADAYENEKFQITPLSKILIKFIQMFEGESKSVGLTEKELNTLLSETKVTKHEK